METRGDGRHFPRMVLMVSGDFISRLIEPDLSTIGGRRGYFWERVENNPLNIVISFRDFFSYRSFLRLFLVALGFQMYIILLQRSAKVFVHGCEKFVTALAYLFCLAMPGSCLARFAYFLADLCKQGVSSLNLNFFYRIENKRMSLRV